MKKILFLLVLMLFVLSSVINASPIQLQLNPHSQETFFTTGQGIASVQFEQFLGQSVKYDERERLSIMLRRIISELPTPTLLDLDLFFNMFLVARLFEIAA